MKNGSAVLVGGFIGESMRAALGLLLTAPLATLAVNLAGTFVLSFWTYWGIKRGGCPTWFNLGLGTGLIGAFTTFSTMSTTTVKLMQASPLIGILYLTATALGGLLMAGLGLWLAKKVGERA